jgi:putative flippase GtrA
MKTRFKEFILYNKALLVSILASGIDMGTMYMLDNNTNLAENLIIGISSGIGLLIQFVGQRFWTFRENAGSMKELKKQILMFFGLEISLIFLVIFLYDKMYNKIEEKVKELKKRYHSTALGIFFEKDGNELSTLGKMLLKSGIVFIIFNVVSYPLWRYFIFIN